MFSDFEEGVMTELYKTPKKHINKEYSRCGIVLDITNRKITLEECIKCIEDRASDRCLNNTEVIIKDKNEVIKILRVKK